MDEESNLPACRFPLAHGLAGSTFRLSDVNYFNFTVTLTAFFLLVGVDCFSFAVTFT